MSEWSSNLHEAAEQVRSGAPLSWRARLALADWLEQSAWRIEKGHHTGSRHSHRVARAVLAGVSDERAGMSQILGRTVESRASLTEDEAWKVIDHLKARETAAAITAEQQGGEA